MIILAKGYSSQNIHHKGFRNLFLANFLHIFGFSKLSMISQQFIINISEWIFTETEDIPGNQDDIPHDDDPQEHLDYKNRDSLTKLTWPPPPTPSWQIEAQKFSSQHFQRQSRFFLTFVGNCNVFGMFLETASHLWHTGCRYRLCGSRGSGSGAGRTLGSPVSKDS